MNARWTAVQGRATYGKDLKPGDLITIDCHGFRHQPWVLVSVTPREDRFALIVRPIGDIYDFAQFNQTLSMRQWAHVQVLPEHYSVCVKCGEIPPCSEVWVEGISDAAAERAARYEVAGVCPACTEPVTRRQEVHRFEVNLFVPLGPAVTFHTRRRCATSAIRYDQQLAQAEGREPRLSCGGLLVEHLDTVRTCTNITCPGVGVAHGNYARCTHTAGGRCNRTECWAVA